jgi:hypothetical protein
VTNSSDIAKLLASNFVERRDVKAIQTNSGAYIPHRVGPQPKYEDRPLAPFTLASLVEHVETKQTFGHYLVNPETGTTRIFLFDIDFNKSSPYHDPDLNLDAEINPREVWSGPTTTCKRDLALQLFAMANGLAIRTQKLLGIKVIVAYSGSKGLHVIGCLPPRTPAADARAMGVYVMESLKVFEPLRGANFWKHTTGYPSLEIELFPKQDEVRADGYGNLVRLPLGLNRKSGKPGFFLKQDVPFGSFKVDEDVVEVLTNGSLR